MHRSGEFILTEDVSLVKTYFDKNSLAPMEKALAKGRFVCYN